jgi:hypothetical protein
MVKFPLRLVGWQRIKKIGQLDSATHYGLGFSSPEMFLDIETISSIVETFNRVGGSQDSADHRLE